MPHANDMTFWDEIRCQRGHRTHQTRIKEVLLAENDSYWDYPRIPPRFSDKFNMEVWDWRKYKGDGPYCPGHDVVSEVIYDLGVWEQCETAVMSMVFEAGGPGSWFVDFGCQIGWYSVLAARQGLNVLAFDADPECVGLATANLEANAGEGERIVEKVRFGVDDVTFEPEAFRAADGGRLPICVKIDLEGAERFAIESLRYVLDDVGFALIEISPVFNDSYLALTQGLVLAGFEPYEIPPRGDPPIQLSQLVDLRPFHLDAAAVDQIPTWHQRNVLFVRGGLS